MTERERDATLRAFSGYVMKRAFNAIQADVNAALAPFDLRMGTFSTLVMIVDNPGLRQSQLADVLAIEPPNLVLVIDELERRGLITRERAVDDRRAYALLVTLAGRRLHDAALAAVKAHEARMTAGLTDAERAQLIRALRRIEDNGGMGHGSGPLSRP